MRAGRRLEEQIENFCNNPRETVGGLARGAGGVSAQGLNARLGVTDGKMCLGLSLSVLICQSLIFSSAMTKYTDSV